MPIYAIRYNWRTTALNEVLFRGVVASDAEAAMEEAFEFSGHDNREGFFRDLEAVLTGVA